MDPYRWLEELDGDASMAWVRARNAATFQALSGERYERLRAEILAVLESDERIPYPYWHDDRLYNLWQDAANPRGLWRRTTLAGFRRPEPEWEVLLDVDALSEDEGESWVFQSADLLHPDGSPGTDLAVPGWRRRGRGPRVRRPGTVLCGRWLLLAGG
jgi:prolyl oligopeptidase